MQILPLNVSPNKGTGKVFAPRDYQLGSIERGIAFFNETKGSNEIHVLPTGAGKSVCVAGVCEGYKGEILVLQPSQEILKQNYAKFISNGGHAGVFSASVGRKDLSRVTFASIQSVMSRVKGVYVSMHNFTHYKCIIIDECHLGSSPKESQLVTLIHAITRRTGSPPKILGYTATPFRLYPHSDKNGNKDSMLKFLTRTSPRIFGKLGYFTQIKELSERGYLAPCKYYNVVDQLSHGFDRNAIKVNSTGADYDEGSLQMYYDTINFKEDIVKIIRRINKTGRQVLVFMSSVADAEWVSSQLHDSATVTGKTPKPLRGQIEEDFKSGKLRSVVNCGVWTVGFDHVPLKVVMLARPLRSLAMYYQMFGRAMRPFEGQDAWLVDACRNLHVFGRLEDITVDFDIKGLPVIKGTNGKLLTGVPLKEQEIEMETQVFG